jgi:hypothetical protein
VWPLKLDTAGRKIHENPCKFDKSNITQANKGRRIVQAMGLMGRRRQMGAETDVLTRFNKV